MAKICLIGCNDNSVKYANLLNMLNALACVCDEDQNNAITFAKRYNLLSSNNNHYYYTSIQDVMNDTNIDGIVIATDNNKYLTLIKEIVNYIKNDDRRRERKNIHILVDEPLASDYNECKEIARLIDSNKGRVTLMPCYIEYFNPIIEEVKHTIKGYNPILFTFENSIAYNEKKQLNLRTIIHNDITILVYLLKELPSYVSSISMSKNSNELIASLIAYSKSKLVAEIIARVMSIKEEREAKEIKDNGSSVIERLYHRRLKIVCTDDTILDINPLVQELKIIHCNDNAKIVRKDNVNKLYLLVSNFIAAIDGREKLKVTVDDALLVERIKDAIVLSSRLGSPIYIGNK